MQNSFDERSKYGMSNFGEKSGHQVKKVVYASAIPVLPEVLCH